MIKKYLIINTTSLVLALVCSQTALADNMVIPVYKSPSASLPAIGSRDPSLRSLNDEPPAVPTDQQLSQQYKDALANVNSMNAERKRLAKRDQPTAQVQSKSGSGFSQASYTANHSNQKALSTSDMNFYKMLRNLNPLTPEQIKMMHAMYTKTQQAKIYPRSAQSPSISSVNVDLQPNSAPPVISLSPGIVTSLAFLDSTGQPWPIQFYDVGNPTDYDAKQASGSSSGKAGSNTLLLQSKKDNTKPGNIAVMLQNNPTPIMLALATGQKVINYRVDLHIPGKGPNANHLSNSTLPGMNNGSVMTALNGIAPTGSKLVLLEGCDSCQAWRSGKYLFLRTKSTLLSPSWIGSSQSADGTHAYKLPRSPVLLTFSNGKITKINVKY